MGERRSPTTGTEDHIGADDSLCRPTLWSVQLMSHRPWLVGVVIASRVVSPGEVRLFLDLGGIRL